MPEGRGRLLELKKQERGFSNEPERKGTAERGRKKREQGQEHAEFRKTMWG